MTASAIEATGLVKAFGSTRALDGFDLTVPTGQVTGFLGLWARRHQPLAPPHRR